MKTLKFLSSLLVPFLFSSLSQAYYVAIYKSDKAISFKNTARILVSGRGTDLTILPQRSALGRALLYEQNFPDDQVVIISVFEGASVEKAKANKKALVQAGLQIVIENDKILNTESVHSELMKFSAIRSLEFFGHNSPSLGAQTDGLGARFDYRKKVIDELSGHFTSDAYVMLHGCNSGWIIAPDIAKRWNVPVSGTFTQTRFERLHSDGHYYLYQTGRYPNDKWAINNPELNNTPCIEGGCMRQRSAFSRYIGKWGEFDGPTLSHDKFICLLNENDCKKRMALSLYGFLSERPLTRNASFQNFKETAKEYLCPVYIDRSKAEACLNALTDIDEGNGNPFIHFVVNHPQLTCSLNKCEAKMACDDHKCVLRETSSKKSQTLVQEYLAFVNGYQLLKEEGLLP